MIGLLILIAAFIVIIGLPMIISKKGNNKNYDVINVLEAIRIADNYKKHLNKDLINYLNKLIIESARKHIKFLRIYDEAIEDYDSTLEDVSLYLRKRGYIVSEIQKRGFSIYIDVSF